eukprot:scaffold25_cov342-Pavlova_lutheri.AAC.23
MARTCAGFPEFPVQSSPPKVVRFCPGTSTWPSYQGEELPRFIWISASASKPVPFLFPEWDVRGHRTAGHECHWAGRLGHSRAAVSTRGGFFASPSPFKGSPKVGSFDSGHGVVLHGFMNAPSICEHTCRGHGPAASAVSLIKHRCAASEPGFACIEGLGQRFVGPSFQEELFLVVPDGGCGLDHTSHDQKRRQSLHDPRRRDHGGGDARDEASSFCGVCSTGRPHPFPCLCLCPPGGGTLGDGETLLHHTSWGNGRSDASRDCPRCHRRHVERHLGGIESSNLRRGDSVNLVVNIEGGNEQAWRDCIPTKPWIGSRKSGACRNEKGKSCRVLLGNHGSGKVRDRPNPTLAHQQGERAPGAKSVRDEDSRPLRAGLPVAVGTGMDLRELKEFMQAIATAKTAFIPSKTYGRPALYMRDT